MNRQSRLRQIPKMDRLMNEAAMIELTEKYGYHSVLEAARMACQELRETEEGTLFQEKRMQIIDTIKSSLNAAHRRKMQRVINGTGVILHTNLGRAPLGKKTVETAAQLMCGYTNLEFDLETGRRGSRYSHFETELCRLTGAEAAVAVNNNAAAVLVTLSALAKGKEVLVSRGELVEIGGKFRVPDVMEQSGAILNEVGTTNRTYALDYENHISGETAAILKVHTSNYRILGFTHSASVKELAETAHRAELPLLVDLGSGAVDPCYETAFTGNASPGEPRISEVLADGADLVCFSGDKLFGGPQAGMIVGKRALIEKISCHPLMRAVRIDKFTAAALEQTIHFYLEEQRDEIPILQMAGRSGNELKEMAECLRQMVLDRINASHTEKGVDDLIPPKTSFCLTVEPSASTTGGGSMPGQELPGYALCISDTEISAERLHRRLLDGEIPILTRIEEERIYLDVRTVFEEELEVIAWELAKILLAGSRQESVISGNYR